MTNLFSDKKSKQNILAILLAILIFVAGFIFWQKLFSNGTILEEEDDLIPQKEIKINFSTLEKIKELEAKLVPFLEIEPFEEELGRANPFLP